MDQKSDIGLVQRTYQISKSTVNATKLVYFIDCLKLKYQNEMSCDERNRFSGIPTRSDINQAVHAQKMARSLKFQI